MEKSLVLVGGGRLAREIVGWLQVGAWPARWAAPRGFIADYPNDEMVSGYGVPWLGSPDDFQSDPADGYLMCASEPPTKKAFVERLAPRNLRYVQLVHPSALLHPRATLGIGVVLLPQSVVSADANVGDFVTVNLLSTIGHDARVGMYSTLSSHVDVTGRVTIGASVMMGSGARVIPGVTVEDNAVVGAGATVVRRVAAGTTVFASPAKRL